MVRAPSSTQPSRARACRAHSAAAAAEHAALDFRVGTQPSGTPGKNETHGGPRIQILDSESWVTCHQNKAKSRTGGRTKAATRGSQRTL